ncbi:MAG: phosphonate C-P lyase system protein PhnH [Rhodoferax sp.]|uniref:phosphonate C-P lyase system protein PhnH n=1 Tax=Rhodoferax sp. TaxID=50421 RepID=UPI00271A3922|nr:phosphonate C-P lyase system protein PhnH [Rhodoferax sp.]MDO8451180.1 phosphonate C-P lyase system protein PhnH [Rhodoferax sp.]
MNGTQTLAAGLLDGVHESQQVFRAVLDALARPGQVRTLGPALPGVALGGAMARLLLSLSDDETPVWWQCEDAGLQHWLRFHVGAPVAEWPDTASFAVLTDSGQGLTLTDFAAGTAASPEFSATLLVELPSLTDGPALEWRGPGIQEVQRVGLQGLPADFWTQWHANHAAFPQGVDIIFTCGEDALGLPRTTRVRRLEGV